ncbi:MAG: cation:proton antiporter [Verrucomicrobia bacterium]|jgi:multicomponent Na+:H+ antiporter subunit C|nr:cation:proton antiporter [Verrucomicrobiota bacterium]
MTVLLSIVTGVLFATGLYMMLRRSITKLLLGLLLLANAANLLIFVASGPVKGSSPLVAEGALALERSSADPLPQALILTAIVIGFGVLAFAVILFSRVYAHTGSDDSEELIQTEK